MLKSSSHNSKRRKRIAITMGDACGVGPEVTAAAIEGLSLPKNVELLIIGNEHALRPYWKLRSNIPCVIHLEHAPARKHLPGKPTAESARDSLLYLQHAIKLLKAKEVTALVTAPVSKEAISAFHPGFKGHTSFLAEAFKQKSAEMLFVAPETSVVLLTHHVAVKDIPKLVTTERIISVVRSTASFLAQHFNARKIRVAVCGLNPHAGEGGHIGREEITQIIPAIHKLKGLGLSIDGPLPADTVFEPHVCARYDLIVAMYHDQALTALKAKYFNDLVNATVGLPFVRTSPAHGTAFNIAGQRLAHPGSMSAAINLAAELA